MAHGFSHHRRVEFRDTDAAGIAHFSVYYTWMEQAEHAALRSLGLSVMPRPSSMAPGADVSEASIGDSSRSTNGITWPRVAAQCDFLRPLRFEDEVEIRVSIVKLGQKSVTYRFEFCSQGHSIANGQITAVCCRILDGRLQSTPIPTDVAARLQTLVA